MVPQPGLRLDLGLWAAAVAPACLDSFGWSVCFCCEPKDVVRLWGRRCVRCERSTNGHQCGLLHSRCPNHTRFFDSCADTANGLRIRCCGRLPRLAVVCAYYLGNSQASSAVSASADMNAIAVFGSVARGNADAWSDADLLLVNEDSDRLRLSARMYERLGWSTTSMRWTDLRRQVASGSLFAVHLRDEARILQDPKDRLRRLLNTVRVRSRFDTEYEASAALLSLIVEVPPHPLVLGWAYDVLAVAFRCMAVPYLAQRRAVAFDTDQILRQLREFGALRDEHAALRVSRLRVMKRVYRSGRLPEDGIVHFQRDFEYVCEIFDRNLEFRQVRTLDFLEHAHRTVQQSSDRYCAVRAAEAVLRATQALEVAEALRLGTPRWVSSPSAYGLEGLSGAERSVPPWTEDVQNLANACPAVRQIVPVPPPPARHGS